MVEGYTTDCPGKSASRSFLSFDLPFISYSKKKKKKGKDHADFEPGFVGFFSVGGKYSSPQL